MSKKETIHVQQELKEKYYGDAMRYMDNAKEYLKNAKKEGYIYRDTKYVRTACSTAYSGLLIAMDGFLILKGIEKYPKKRKSIEFYQENLGKINRKMLDDLNIAYKILHLYGYYDGLDDAVVVKRGFDVAQNLIEKIKPTNGAIKN